MKSSSLLQYLSLFAVSQIANGQPKEEDTKEYTFTYDAVAYPNDDGYGLKGVYALWKKYNAADSFLLTFNTQIEAQQTKNKHIYQSYVQFVDQVKTKKREDGAESYESIICSVENDFAKQSEIRPDTVRFNQFCGT